MIYSSSVMAGGLAKTTTTTRISPTTEVSTTTQVSTVISTVTITQTNSSSTPSVDNSLVQVTGTLTVPAGSGAGTLVINVKNSAYAPIVSITVASDPVNGELELTSNGATCGTGEAFTIYSGDLPIGQSTSGVATASTGLAAGNTYYFAVIVTFSGGTSTQVANIDLTAQV